jgi:cobalt/nickel transport system permease protein
VRPDLVYGARGSAAPLVLRGPDGEVLTGGQDAAPSVATATAARRPGRFLLGGVVVAALLAGVVSFAASASPDGLERVAQDHGFDSAAADHALGEQPLADYGEVGGLPVGVAGLIGVGVTVAVGGGLFLLVRRRGAATPVTAEAAPRGAGDPSAARGARQGGTHLEDGSST